MVPPPLSSGQDLVRRCSGSLLSPDGSPRSGSLGVSPGLTRDEVNRRLGKPVLSLREQPSSTIPQ